LKSTSHFIFQISKGCKWSFCVQGDCLQILTRLAQNLHHKLSTKCVTHHSRNLYVIVFSCCLIRAEFLFNNVTSIFASILYLTMLQIAFFCPKRSPTIISTWLAKKYASQIVYKCVTNCLQNLYFIVLSKLIRAKFSFDTIPSVWQGLQYCNMKIYIHI
jgi:hypothetical protein